MNKHLLMHLVLLPVCLGMCSCATLTDKPSYNPMAYGTGALLNTVASEKSSSCDARGAAQELADRKLSESDGRILMKSLCTQKHGAVRVAILKTMLSQQMSYIYPDLVEYLSSAPDPETGIEAASTAVALAPDADAVMQLSKGLLLNGKFPEIRARAANLIASNFADQAEPLFIQALNKETSASAATFMCEYLAQKGTKASYAILDNIANDVMRKYDIDKFLGVKTTAETVRAAAVRGAERFR